MTTLRRDAAANRAALLDAAAHTVAVDPTASMGTIARAAGLSRRALYGHFPDRDALLAELIATRASRFNDIAAHVDASDARYALALLGSRLWQAASQVRLAASLALSDSHVAATAAALRPLRERLLQIVQHGQSSGSIRPDLPATVLARLIEEAARAAVIRMPSGGRLGHTLVIKAVLSIAGLSWLETQQLLQSHPELEEDSCASI